MMAYMGKPLGRGIRLVILSRDGFYRQRWIRAGLLFEVTDGSLGEHLVGSNRVLMDDHSTTTTMLTPGRELLEQPGGDVLSSHLDQTEV
jgi:hypothetical protein